MSLKVIIYAICKNESKFVDRFMSFAKEADAVYISDTGSTDDTVQKFKNHGAIVNQISVIPWRFDEARNKSLEFVPDDVDICISVDIDEIMQPGWRENLESKWKLGNNKFRCTICMTTDPSTGLTFIADRIHSRKNYVWKHPIHEVVVWDSTEPEQIITDDSFIILHDQDLTKSRAHYLPLLEMAVKEDPECDRNSYYLGREYFYYGRYTEAIAELQRGLNLPRSVWKPERAFGMRMIAESNFQLGNIPMARVWAWRATEECPDIRETWYTLAKISSDTQDWETCFYAFLKAIKIAQKPNIYLNEAEAWGWQLINYGAISAFYLGFNDIARKYGVMAWAMAPDIKLLSDNLRYYS